MQNEELYRVVISNSTGNLMILETGHLTDAIKRAWAEIHENGVDPAAVDIYTKDPATELWFSWWTKGGA